MSCTQLLVTAESKNGEIHSKVILLELAARLTLTSSRSLHVDCIEFIETVRKECVKAYKELAATNPSIE